jgi:hypothetical protein
VGARDCVWPWRVFRLRLSAYHYRPRLCYSRRYVQRLTASIFSNYVLRTYHEPRLSRYDHVLLQLFYSFYFPAVVHELSALMVTSSPHGKMDRHVPSRPEGATRSSYKTPNHVRHPKEHPWSRRQSMGFFRQPAASFER